MLTKKELENKVQELRSLKAMKEDLENELKAVECEIISYMTENELDTEITDTAKITYKPQSRTTLDKGKLQEIFGDDLKPFEKTTSFNVLRKVDRATIKRLQALCVDRQQRRSGSNKQFSNKTL